jgi:hypothetical protein
MLASFALSITALKRDKDSSMLQLMFFLLKLSDAAPNMATSSAFASS